MSVFLPVARLCSQAYHSAWRCHVSGRFFCWTSVRPDVFAVSAVRVANFYAAGGRITINQRVHEKVILMTPFRLTIANRC